MRVAMSGFSHWTDATRRDATLFQLLTFVLKNVLIIISDFLTTLLIINAKGP